MKLCNDCINRLYNDLSTEAVKTFKEVYPLFQDRELLSTKELGMKAQLSRQTAERIIGELKSNFIFNYQFQGRKLFYQLTEPGEQLVELMKKEDEDNQTQEIIDELKEEVIIEKKEFKEEDHEVEVNEESDSKSEQLVWDFDL